jgi:hypothetical protein
MIVGRIAVFQHCFRSVSKNVSNGVSNALEKRANETPVALNDSAGTAFENLRSVSFGVSNGVSNDASNETKHAYLSGPPEARISATAV